MATPTPSIHPDDSREQRRSERRIASRYRNDFAWRVLAEATWGFGAWAGVIALALAGVLPYWLACGANAWIAYLMYMPLHEATHGNVSGRNGHLRWVDDWVGALSAIPLWFSYRSHRLSHMQHHAHTNEPGRDPDQFLAGPLQQLLPKYALLSTLQLVLPLISLFPGGEKWLPAALARGLRQGSASPEEVAYDRRFQRLCLAAFVVLSLAGYFVEALVLWYLPARIGFFIVVVSFGWLPHHPHDERGRYRDTRITLFPGATLLIRGQNHHLLHHMFPRVPHYRLPALFREMRPILAERGARIEGPLAGPGAPKILLRSAGRPAA